MLLTQEIFSLVEVSRICEKLLPLTLKEYLNVYGSEVEDYYEVGVPIFEETDKRVSVICLVDMDEEDSTKRRKKSPGRRAGLERRLKYRHRYTYQNPLNRIHGYLILEECEDDNVLKVSVICSSFFSPSRGVGSDLMNITLAVAKLLGYSDVILEIGNEHSQGPDSEYEEEEEEEDFEDEEEEELYALMETLYHEFWRKCMRHRRPGRPYYNIDQDYIEAMLHGYFVKDNDENEEDDIACEDIYELIDDTESEEDTVEPGDCEYGGYWYQKGKSSQAGIITFYEKFGFEEDKKMRRHFSAVPFPTYRKHLTHSSL